MWYSKYLATLGAGIIVTLALGTVHNASAANPSQPAYTPLYTADFENSTVGNTIQEFSSTTTSAKTTYDNSIIGPFGGQRVVRQENQSNKKGFGGRIVNTSLGKNKEIWVRWFEYFPGNFCFANSVNGDNGGTGGKMKWMRFQYPSNTHRITLKMDGTPGCAAPCNNCMTKMSIDSIVGEAMGWNNIKRRIGSAGFPRSQWNALQVYMYLDDVPASAGGKARIRVWINDVLLAEITDVPTLDGATSKLSSVWWGNYWNGGFPKDQHWYLDEVIITSSKPNTTDSGGRPYIDPKTRIADFGIPPDFPGSIN